MYQYAIIDPRNVPAATEANEMLFSSPVYGIEVTIPAFAKRCVSNLDPQHTDGDAEKAAIEAMALGNVLPPDGSTLATIRPDLDSVGAMAVAEILKDMGLAYLGWPCECDMLSSSLTMGGLDHDPSCKYFGLAERIRLVATADKFARGGWSGPKPLPTRENPWREDISTAESSRPLAAIAAAVMDFKVPLTDRVAMMKRWLLTGEEPAQYREQVEKERLGMIAAIEDGSIKYETRCDGKVAFVESAHRAATMVGYSLAPVVVALNPSFRQGPGDPYRKFTICAFEAKFADIKLVLAELAELEPGWGGSPTIGGSPQGVSSALTIEQVVEVVAKHLH